MKLTIRLERPEDYREVEALTREAFWGVFHPTCDEHYLVHKLRNSRDFVPALDMVAESDGRIVGHILYTKARVTDAAGRENEVLTFGPLSVLPAYWKRGIGTALMRATIDRARELGYRGIVIFGHPDYYCRVGFRPAGEFGIVTGQGMPMTLLWRCRCIRGRWTGSPVFTGNRRISRWTRLRRRPSTTLSRPRRRRIWRPSTRS